MRVLLGTLVALALCAPAAHAADPIVGIGEQSEHMFSDPRYQELGIRHARFLAAWDVTRSDWQTHEMERWLHAARMSGTEVLMAFGRSRREGREKVLPTAARFRREFRRFRARYPWVKTFIPWNEANHCSQPTCHRPDRAAAYFDVIRSECHRCTALAADVLDQRGMVAWLREFKRHVKHKTPLWGLHNYVDANRFRTSGTRAMLKAVRGRIWFTETGGLVRRKGIPRKRIQFDESPSHAGKAVDWVFRLAALSPRVKRIYFYHWMPNLAPTARWDSALTTPAGRARPALKVIQKWVAASRARKARALASR